MRRILSLTALASLLALVIASADKEAKPLPEHVIPVMQDWLHSRSEAVEACVFREEWRAPTKQFPKGVLTRYATISRVHKGTVNVGERIVLSSPVEYETDTWQRKARRRPNRVSMVDGELIVVLFERTNALEKKDGYWQIGHIVSCFPFGSDFHRGFEQERKRDPQLRGRGHH